MKRRLIVFGARALLAILLIAAGWPKARDPGAFIRDVWNFQLLPETWAYWVAAFVPYVEIIVGVALITGRQLRGAHVIIAGLLGVFVVFHAAAWARGLDVACGCFGAAAEDSPALHPAWWLALLGGMTALLVLSIRAEARARGPGEPAYLNR